MFFEKGRRKGCFYGFNNQEKNDEVYGPEGTSYAFEYRIHDTRLGRFLSVDPLEADFPWYTPYQFAGNKPIWCIDIEGKEDGIATTLMVNAWEKQDKKYLEGEISYEELKEQRYRSQMAFGIGGVMGITGAAILIIAPEAWAACLLLQESHGDL